jgi:hypothetical protein
MANPIETAILELLRARGEHKTICPSEVARAVDPVSWRERMPAVRAAAARLVESGVIVALQRGRLVDPLEARGPIRLAQARAAPKRK